MKQGKRYSQQYDLPEKLFSDSERMRLRFSRLFRALFQNNTEANELGETLEYELGINVFSNGPMGVYINWESHFKYCDIRDVLDTITLTHSFLVDSKLKSDLIAESKRFLKEESVGFTIDDHGGLHPVVDEAFELNRMNTLEGLSGDRFAASREHCRAIDTAMLRTPMDGRQAIRSAFDLNENLFKMAFDGVTHVNSRTIKDKLKKAAKAYSDEHGEILHVVDKQVSGFENWVNSAHFFRHEAGKPEPKQPLESTAVLLVSEGYSYARWMLKLLY